MRLKFYHESIKKNEFIQKSFMIRFIFIMKKVTQNKEEIRKTLKFICVAKDNLS